MADSLQKLPSMSASAISVPRSDKNAVTYNQTDSDGPTHLRNQIEEHLYTNAIKDGANKAAPIIAYLVLGT